MNRVEIKSKLIEIIKKMLLSDLEFDQKIPETIIHFILKNYGCTVTEKSNVKEELDVFLINLQKWIENSYSLTNDTTLKEPEESDFDLNLYEKYLEAETEYCEVTSELMKLLQEVLQHKESYSQYFKDECKAKDISVEVLNKKCQFLKRQFFLKLYGEENALKGHLALQAKLKEELFLLKKKYSELVEYNNKMSEIKSDKTFCELFRVYKELRKIEEMTELIRKM